MPIQNGAAALQAAPVLSISGTATLLAAAPALTASARIITNTAGAALSAAAVLTARTADTTLSAHASLSVSALVTEPSSAHLAAATALTAATSSSSAALRAQPVLLAPGQLGTAVFTAGTHLTASGQRFMPGAAHLAAAPGLTASAAVTERASAALTAPAVLSAVPLVTERAAASLAASARLTAAMASSSAALHAQPSLQATAFALRTAAARLSAAAVLAHGPVIPSGAIPASVAAPGIAVPGRAAPGSAGTATGTIAGTPALVIEQARAALSAHPALSAAAYRTQRAASAMAAAASLTASAHHLVTGRAALAAVPSLSYPSGPLGAAITDQAGVVIEDQSGAPLQDQSDSGVFVTEVAAAHLAAAAALTPAAVTSPGARLSAAARLTAAAVPRRAARAVLSGVPRLTATAHGTTLPSGALRAAPVLAAVPVDVIVTRAALAASASLAAVSATRPGRPLPLPHRGPQPSWQRDVQHFAVAQERQRHAQALWQFGELVMFALLWTPAELGLGLAQRCTRCYTPASVIPLGPPQPDYGTAAEAQISAAYGQGNQYRCTLCYGTQLIAAAPAEVPGVRALLVRPAILTDTDQNQQRSAKGVVKTGSVSIQATPDFRVNTLDYCFRSDGRRYQLNVPQRTTLRTGFASPWQQTAAITYNISSATLEDPKASVAYIIPPADQLLAQALGTYTRIPANYAWIEEINGPLIPGETPPPAAAGSYQPPVTLGS